MHIKITISLFCILLLFGCVSQTKITDAVGTYEGNHLMLYKKLELRPDSTYTYMIEGDMYAYPIRQEGFWEIKNNSVKLSASEDYKKLDISHIDSIDKHNLFFRFFDIEGKPVNDFMANLICDDNENRYTLTKVKENLYKVVLSKECENISIENTNNLYESFSIELKKSNGNMFDVYLFVKNEIQKDQWRFKLKNEILHYKKGFTYNKISN